MMTDSRLFQAAIFSFIFHLIVFGWLPFIQSPLQISPNAKLIDKALKVERISKQAIEKYRQRGIKGGKKGFSIRTGNKQKIKRKRPTPKRVTGKSNKNTSEDISLKNLSTGIDFEKIIKDKKELDEKNKTAHLNQRKDTKSLSSDQRQAIIRKEIIAAEQGLPLTSLRSSQTVNNFRRQESLRRNLIKEMGTNSTASEILSNTNFNLHFEPPEGIAEDELNSVEKIFYSFQKRTFISYVNSFYSSYQNVIIKRPTLMNAIKNEKHLMTGKVIFDKEGNIVRIKILRSSTNDDLHELFETTLKDIRSLPNPPNDLIKDREEFTIYYQLRIN